MTKLAGESEREHLPTLEEVEAGAAASCQAWVGRALYRVDLGQVSRGKPPGVEWHAVSGAVWIRSDRTCPDASGSRALQRMLVWPFAGRSASPRFCRAFRGDFARHSAACVRGAATAGLLQGGAPPGSPSSSPGDPLKRAQAELRPGLFLYMARR